MTVFSWPTLKRWSNSTETLTIPATGVKRVLGSYLGEGNPLLPLPDRVAPYSSPNFETLSGVWHGGQMTVFSWPTLKRWSNSTETLANAATGVKQVLGSYLGEGNAVVRLPGGVAPYSSPHFEALSGVWHGGIMTVFSRPILNRWSNPPETLTNAATGVKQVMGSYLWEGNALVRLPDPVASLRAVWAVGRAAGAVV